MKKLLLAVFVVGIYNVALAQDTIYYKKNNSIIARVIEVAQHEVKYKRFENPDGPIYTVPKEDLLWIRYANGTEDNFGYRRVRGPVPRPNKYRSVKTREIPDWGSQLISSGIWVFGSPEADYDFLHNLNRSPVFASYINYEKQFAQGKAAVVAMPFIGWNRKAYGGALGVKVYPKNYGTVQFHIGPQFTVSVQDYVQTQYNNEYGYRQSNEYQTTITSLQVNLGFNININPSWVITNDFSFGGILGNSNYKRYNEYYDNGFFDNDGLIGARLGLAYRFK